MKKYWIAAAAALIGVVAFGIYSSIPVQADGGGNTQIFTPARFALVQGELNVTMLQNNLNGNGNNNSTQKAMFRVDTVTGEVWVLQLSIVAPNQPNVTSASWARVMDAQQVQQQNQQNQQMIDGGLDAN